MTPGGEPALLDDEVLTAYVRTFLGRREEFLACGQEHETPFYIFDEKALIDQTDLFTDAFAKEIPVVRTFFAVKSNNHPLVSQRLVSHGLGLDVSSGPELALALQTPCREIIFSGPGKTPGELEMVLRARDRVTILMDSFAELERLDQIATKHDFDISAGVRLTTEEKGLWRKFGIRLDELGDFMDKAERSEHVVLRGLQFHTSWNREPFAQVSFLCRLGERLGSMHGRQLKKIEFLDIGGGYWPARGEWIHCHAAPVGRLVNSIPVEGRQCKALIFPAVPIDVFAREIGKCLREHIFPHIRCRIFTEPGRWLVDDSMHILAKVVDKKAEDLVVLDAGTNIVGWERFETDYCPVINLSQPSLTERPCMLFGSLCTPHDIWGYGYFGDGIDLGDTLLIPNQGAYTYSLCQEFIKPKAKVVSL